MRTLKKEFGCVPCHMYKEYIQARSGKSQFAFALLFYSLFPYVKNIFVNGGYIFHEAFSC